MVEKPNSRDVRPVDVGPALSKLRAALPALMALNCLLSKGVSSAKRFRQYVPSFTDTTHLSVSNPWNLDCHGTPDYRPKRIIAQALKNYPSKDGGYQTIRRTMKLTLAPREGSGE